MSHVLLRTPLAARPLRAYLVVGSLMLAVLALLGGCSAPSDPPGAIGLRNPTAPVASQANAALARLEGRWIVVEGAGVLPGQSVEIRGNVLTMGSQTYLLEDQGAGRFSTGSESLWVHWLDIDARTAAIGDPGGGRVWIMDRTGRPAERLRAAHEILDWYGYDLDRMQRL